MTGTEFRKLRRALGLTQAELAKALEVTSNTVARWEQGVHAVSPLARFALIALARERGGKSPRSHSVRRNPYRGTASGRTELGQSGYCRPPKQ